MELLLLLSLFCLQFVLSNGHGRLVEPPSRASMWRFGFDTPKNYNDNELNCGGVGTQWSPPSNGRCGICGDPWWGGRPHEVGGPYASGTIVRSYNEGDIIEAVVQVTANHKGFFEFKVCPVKNEFTEVSQECLDRHVLRLADDPANTSYYIEQGNRHFSVRLLLPPGFTCNHCVLQWTWVCGNSWGFCEDGSQGLGCGQQEMFRACSDISISASTHSFVEHHSEVEEFSHAPILPTLPPVNIPSAQPFHPPDYDYTDFPSSPRPHPPSVFSTYSPPVFSTGPPSLSEEVHVFNEESFRNPNFPSQDPLLHSANPSLIPTVSESFRNSPIPPSPLVSTAINRKHCRADTSWRRLPGMDGWCDLNCNHIPPHCPEGWCVCEGRRSIVRDVQQPLNEIEHTTFHEPKTKVLSRFKKRKQQKLRRLRGRRLKMLLARRRKLLESRRRQPYRLRRFSRRIQKHLRKKLT